MNIFYALDEEAASGTQYATSTAHAESASASRHPPAPLGPPGAEALNTRQWSSCFCDPVVTSLQIGCPVVIISVD